MMNPTLFYKGALHEGGGDRKRMALGYSPPFGVRIVDARNGIISTWAGPVSFAVGCQLRREEINNSVGSVYAAGAFSWAFVEIVSGMGQGTRVISVEAKAHLRARLESRLPADEAGRISFTPQANAVTGRVPL